MGMWGSSWACGDLRGHAGDFSSQVNLIGQVDFSGHVGDLSGHVRDLSGHDGDLSGRVGDLSGLVWDISGSVGDISGHVGYTSGCDSILKHRSALARIFKLVLHSCTCLLRPSLSPLGYVDNLVLCI